MTRAIAALLLAAMPALAQPAPTQRAFAVFAPSTAAKPLLTQPGNTCMMAIRIQNPTEFPVTGGVNIGTAPGAADIAAAVVVGAHANISVEGGAILRSCLGPEPTPIYISAGISWNKALLNIQTAY